MGKKSQAGAEDKKVFLVAQEIELAKLLAGNNKSAREKALKNLKKWFANKNLVQPFGEDNFQRIWKGLFYTMWMSDKPLTQEECAENIASLVHFPSLQNSLLFFKAGMETLINEWFGIDQLRLDKFLMLVRRLLRHMLMSLKERGFTNVNIELFNNVLENTIMSSKRDVPIGLFMHFTEIFLEEVSKVSERKIHPDRIVDMLQPFVKKLAITSDDRQIHCIRKFIFVYLIRQSNLGLEYQEKYNAWKQLGFPGNINSMQKVKIKNADKKISDEEIEADTTKKKDKPLDPRAGRVNVELPQLPFNSKKVVTALLSHRFDEGSNKKTRKIIGLLANQFTKVSQNIYPFGIKKIDLKEDNYDTNIRKAAKRLIKFDQQLLGPNKKRKRGKENEEVEHKRRKLEDNELMSQDSGAETEEVVSKATSTKQKKGKNTLKSDADGANKVKKSQMDSNKNEIKKSPKGKKNDQDINSKKNKIKKSQEEKRNDQGIDGNKNNIKENEVEVKVSENIVQKSTVLKDKNLGVRTKIRKIKNKTRNLKKQLQVDHIFARNSGTWVVYNVKDNGDNENVPTLLGDPSESSATVESLDTSGSSYKIHNKVDEIVRDTVGTPGNASKGVRRSRRRNSVTDIFSPSFDKEQKLVTSSPVEALFPKFEWEEQENQEIPGTFKLISHNSSKIDKSTNDCSLTQKIKGKNRLSLDSTILTRSLNIKLVKGNGTSPNLLQQKIKGKNRISIDPNLVVNPFQSCTKPKKVKINTKLNVSQEIDEHHRQILQSPGIPYDANKRPLKPLLKTPVKNTPINPFYNGSLNSW